MTSYFLALLFYLRELYFNTLQIALKGNGREMDAGFFFYFDRERYIGGAFVSQIVQNPARVLALFQFRLSRVLR